MIVNPFTSGNSRAKTVDRQWVFDSAHELSADPGRPGIEGERVNKKQKYANSLHISIYIYTNAFYYQQKSIKRSEVSILRNN